MKTQQFEITLPFPTSCPRPVRRHGRRTRARWWFRQMRAQVERAADWLPLENRAARAENC